MADRPIIFSGPMVQALLAGRKSQTRRVLKPQPVGRPELHEPMSDEDPYWAVFDADEIATRVRVPFAVGDRLYVREAHYLSDTGDYEIAVCAEDADAVREHFDLINGIAAQHNLAETWRAPHLKLRPSIHMPRWASRLTLLVTGVQVMRLQDISEADAVSEGITALPNSNGPNFYTREIWRHGGCIASHNTPTALGCFRGLWEDIHGQEAWGENPWVVAVTFAVHRGNIDVMGVL